MSAKLTLKSSNDPDVLCPPQLGYDRDERHTVGNGYD